MRPFGVIHHIHIPRAKRKFRGDRRPEIQNVMIVNVVEQQEPCRNVKQSKAHDDKAHNGPAPKGDYQTAIQTRYCAVRRPGTRIRCRLHAEETAKATKEAPGKERDRHKRVLNPDNRENDKYKEQGDKDYRNRSILPFEIGICPDAHIVGNRFHFTIAVRSTLHKTIKEQCHAQSNQRCNRDKVPIRRNRKHRNLAYWVLSP